MKRYLIKEIFRDNEGNTMGAATIGSFRREEDRDIAFKKQFLDRGRLGIKMEEEA